MMAPMRGLLVIAAALLLSAESASAAVQVLGGGLAERCWREAAKGGTSAAAVRVCGDALDEEALSPRDRAATLVNRGILRLRARAWDQAGADFDRALRLRPELAEAYVNRGAVRLGQRRWKEAVEDLDRGLALGSAEPEKAWYNKGLALEGQGDLRGAYAAYLKAAELKPEWDAPRRELARFSVQKR